MLGNDPPQDPSWDGEGLYTYEGTITSFSQKSAWGFINSPEVHDLYGKDVFFHLKDCSGGSVHKGQKVRFTLAPIDAECKPRASKVESNEPMPENGDEHDGRPQYIGTVLSFSVQSAWGFVDCQEIKDKFGKDVFIHLQDCGGVSPMKGQEVSFVLDETAMLESGKPQGRNVRVLGDASASGQPESTQARYHGVVCQYAEDKVWGFISCPELKEAYGKDVFFHLKDVRGAMPRAGLSVSFMLEPEAAANGKPKAYDIHATEKGAKGGYKGALVPVQRIEAHHYDVGQPQYGGHAWSVDHWGMDAAYPSHDSGPRYSGHIQSFAQEQGWGFIECAALGHAPGKGTFFHTKDFDASMGPPQRGMMVEFSVGQGPTGKEQCKNVRPIASHVGKGALPPVPPPASWTLPPGYSGGKNISKGGGKKSASMDSRTAAQKAGLSEEQYNAMAAANLRALGIAGVPPRSHPY